MITKYDSGIKFADEHIGRLIQWLKKNNLFDNTLIIITSDHGENFNLNDKSDNLPGTHGTTLFDAEIKTPLLIGGSKDFCKKGRYSMQVSNVDILPTILDYFDIQPEQSIRGNSLLQIIKTDNTDQRIAYSEYMSMSKKRNNGQKRGTRSLRTIDNKLIQLNRLSGKVKYEYYDLQNDKNELNNLIREKVTESKIFIKKLQSIISSLKIPKRKVSDSNKFKNDSYKDITNSLKALGYLGD
jgi:arylsulfatase A-like enzyme